MIHKTYDIYMPNYNIQFVLVVKQLFLNLLSIIIYVTLSSNSFAKTGKTVSYTYHRFDSHPGVFFFPYRFGSMDFF